MRKSFGIVLGTAIVSLSLLLSGCDEIKSSVVGEALPEAVQKQFDVLFHDEYISICGIDITKFSQRDSTLRQAYNLKQTEDQYNLSYDKTLLHGRKYSITKDTTGLTYYGSLRDNKPDGFGVICDISGVNVYIGNFKKGQYSGYGVLFSDAPVDENRIDFEIKEGQINESDRDLAVFYAKRYVNYEGEWIKGERSGNGNSFTITNDGVYTNPEISGLWSGSFYPIILKGKFSNDELHGNTEMYCYGCLMYEGECKGTEPHGKGTSYYTNGQVQYKGQWKKGKYDGTGTLYDKNGEVEYQGKWSNGDYA